MVEPTPQLPEQEEEWFRKNVLDATYTCTDVLDSGGQARCWYATDNAHRGVAVKVFFKHPGGAAFNDEVQIYQFLGEHANLVRMIDNNPDGLQVF